MKTLIATLLVSTFAAGTALAQPAPFNEAGVTMGHWHLNSRDVEANKKIFVAMGGTAEKRNGRESVRLPGVVINLELRPGAPAPTSGTAGTVINHVGLLVPNVQEAVAKWKTAGVPFEFSRNRTDQGFVT